uniref:BSD domain-containing protein 1 n=1 Tax=Erigeron canadensis TaxID=72917 RepID=UPI001CB8D761|nr:BSD domain-containing protein 1 [Erigeron canadensis]
MNFFKSILLDNNDPEVQNIDTDNNNQSPNHQKPEEEEVENTKLHSGEVSGGGGGLWSFGDLVKTISTRSESVLETYRRDLKEFGSGLRKESDLFREVASRAVKELPEVGASAIDGVLKSTADVFRETSNVDDSDTLETVQNSRVYSRFDSQLNVIQSDIKTYRDDPEDVDEYNKWKIGFVLSDKESEIEKLIGDNGNVEGIYRKVVPDEVDSGTFWCRYFYRVYKLKQQEDLRANFVRRSLNVDDEEELSWDVDDDEEESDLPETGKKHSSLVADDDMEKNSYVTIVDKINLEAAKPSDGNASDMKVESVPKTIENHDSIEITDKDDLEEDVKRETDVASVDKDTKDDLKPSGGNMSDEKVESVTKIEENPKTSSQEEEDLEWDEIGDIGDNDENSISHSETSKKGDVFKRLSTPQEDEDLSWDIEDDDEPVKANSCK